MDLQDRNDKMAYLIVKRDVERKLDIEKKKETKSKLSAENEKIGFFEQIFNEKKREIELALQRTSVLDSKDLAEHFNNLSKNLSNLQKYVAASNIFLRSYDIKVCKDILQELTSRAKELEDGLLPKKKFGFKKRNKRLPKSDDNLITETDFGKTLSGIDLNENFCGFQNEHNASLVLDPKVMSKKDVSLKQLTNCTVQLYGNASTLHMSRLTDCLILCGPVSTSIFVENCSSCRLVIACQQLRLHSSKNVHIYLHVTSRAIMEDCTEISVAPYNLDYERLKDDFKASGLDKTTNNWNCIDDFNWLNAEKPSPNWRFLDAKEIVTNWNDSS